jgi:hypothetical protein
MADLERRDFRLTKGQADYLLRCTDLPGDVRKVLTPARSADVSLLRNERDDIVEELGTRLQKFGFDADWTPTEEGAMIESIIDVLTAPRTNK